MGVSQGKKQRFGTKNHNALLVMGLGGFSYELSFSIALCM